MTVAERIKAKRVCEEDYGLTYGSGPVAVVKKPRFKRGPKTDGFSTGEKDLYRAFGEIKQRERAAEEAEMEKTRLFFLKKTYEGMPTPTMKQ